MTSMHFDYPKNVCFTCSKCGLCCGDTSAKTRHILLLKADAEKIAIFTGQNISKFAHKIQNKRPYIYEMHKNVDTGKCIFLEDNKCTIYKYRPLICRFYPCELLTNEKGKHIFKVTLECPGICQQDPIDTGRKLNEAHFKALLELARIELDVLN